MSNIFNEEDEKKIFYEDMASSVDSGRKIYLRNVYGALLY